MRFSINVLALVVSLVASAADKPEHFPGLSFSPGAEIHVTRPDGSDGEVLFFNKEGKPLFAIQKAALRGDDFKITLAKYAESKGIDLKAMAEDKMAAIKGVRFLEAMVNDKELNLNIDDLHNLYIAAFMLRLISMDEALFPDNPELAAAAPELRKVGKTIQTNIATRLDLPDTYWNYDDVPNTFLSGMAKAVGEALGKVLSEVAEDMATEMGKAGDNLKGLAPKPPEEPKAK